MEPQWLDFFILGGFLPANDLSYTNPDKKASPDLLAPRAKKQKDTVNDQLEVNSAKNQMQVEMSHSINREQHFFGEPFSTSQ